MQWRFRRSTTSHPHRPANIRIHGTTYGRIFVANDFCLLRYQIHDPKERDAVDQNEGLPKELVHELQNLIVPRNNKHMRIIRRLARLKDVSGDAELVLSWREGVDEAAGIVDFAQVLNAIIARYVLNNQNLQTTCTL